MGIQKGAQQREGVAVVMVPLPAQGHLNQLLHLARHIAARGIQVHYATSAAHARQAKSRLHGWHSDAAAIRFHHLPLPPFSAPPPDPNSNFPSHLQPLFDASLHLAAPLAALLRSLAVTTSKLIVIHDSLMSVATDACGSLPNVEAYAFHSTSAFNSLFFYWASRGKKAEVFGLPEISFDGCFTDEFVDFISRQHPKLSADAGRLLNTCRAIEAPFIDRLAGQPLCRNQKLFAIGPLNPLFVETGLRLCHRHECLEWLDQQPAASIVYVSFGTTISFSKKQMDELAAGLAGSGKRYLWVIREADRGDVYAGDSENCCGKSEKKGGGVGMVVRGWAPQLEILSHKSTAAFVSHCGWNSCMESMSNGVAMIAWPMHSDQPANAALVTEVLRVGIPVREWSRRRETVGAAKVKFAIETVMDGEEGKELRSRARALGKLIRRCGGGGEGEGSGQGLDAFIEHIRRGGDRKT